VLDVINVIINCLYFYIFVYLYNIILYSTVCARARVIIV